MRGMLDNEETDTMRTSNGGSSFAVGLICGAAVGAALGLLLAPKDGATTRRELAKSADRIKRRAMQMYDGAADTVGDLTERGARAFEQVNDVADKVVGRVKPPASAAASRADN